MDHSKGTATEGHCCMGGKCKAKSVCGYVVKITVCSKSEDVKITVIRKAPS